MRKFNEDKFPGALSFFFVINVRALKATGGRKSLAIFQKFIRLERLNGV